MNANKVSSLYVLGHKYLKNKAIIIQSEIKITPEVTNISSVCSLFSKKF